MQELYFWQTHDPVEWAQMTVAEDILVESLDHPPSSEINVSILHSTSQLFIHLPAYTFFHSPVKSPLRFRHRHRPQGSPALVCFHPSIRAMKLLTWAPNYILPTEDF